MKEILVVAAILIRNGEFLLARRPPGDPLAGFWEFPGGKTEPGETPEKALSRELREELGVRVRVGEWVADSLITQPRAVIRLQAYFCRLEKGVPQTRFHDALVWTTLESAKEFPLAPGDIPLLKRFVELGFPLG